MKEQTRMILRLAVGLYLVYLAWQLVTGQLAGGSGMNDLLAYGAGAALGLAGLGFCAFALVSYRKERRAARETEPPAEEP